MSGDPDYFRTVSLKLSEVLDDIGVNKRTVLKRRRMILLHETVRTTLNRLLDLRLSIYNFGSQSEGSTTVGLNSDMDALFCIKSFHVIRDWGEWQHGMFNLLMIQDETTSPGYCLLQMLQSDEPLPVPEHLSPYLPAVGIVSDRGRFTGGRVCLKTRFFDGAHIQGVRNGPAYTDTSISLDCVPAYLCKSWPAEAQPWLVRQGIGMWPTEEMKRYCENTGCFVVSVSSKSGLYEEFEWRISTSMAERFLMFSLNITQMRCYIVMKMILKTFINPQCNGVLSSFMCKTVLLHCIQNTQSNSWRPSNLLACLTCCLIVLENFVRQINCPHFIIPENNLMVGRISPRNKHKILEILQNIIRSEGRALLEIPIDNLGTRLQVRMSMYGAFQYYCTSAEIYGEISGRLLRYIGSTLCRLYVLLIEEIHKGNDDVQERLSDFTFELVNTYREIGCNSLKKSALKLLIPLVCSSLGSVEASSEINDHNVISRKALACFSVGLDSDVSSGRLKLASAMYCLGDMNRTEFVLRNIEDLYDLNIVEPVCSCYPTTYSIRQGFRDKSTTGNEELIREILAFCVRFTGYEINCVPQELKYEMFRSTQDDIIERDEDNYWMDWAVVDSLPYLYFLQYKTYGHLQRAADQQQALTKLVTTIETESNLHHRETALNLLGQCMEQENRHNDALRCYVLSLNIRARNNAANFLIPKLLYAFANRHVV